MWVTVSCNKVNTLVIKHTVLSDSDWDYYNVDINKINIIQLNILQLVKINVHKIDIIQVNIPNDHN